MLIDFSFSNFKSFRARQNFSTKRDDGWSSDAPYGTVAAVYGGNAAGKSNFVDALEYVNRFVRKSFVTAADEAGTGRSPYRLDLSGPSEKSVFVVRFDVESSGEYEYEFSVDDDVLKFENL
jgi:predicted ATPase